MMSTDPTTVFLEHIRKHVSDYYGDFVAEQTCVHFVDKQERPRATLYRFRVSNDAQTRLVFVKVPFSPAQTAPTNERVYEKPQLYPPVELHDRDRRHYTALKAIYEYFTNLDIQTLGAIRALDYLPEYHAVLMEASADPKLGQLFLRKNRFYALVSDGELTPAFRNAGHWLRAYHNMPKEEDIDTRHAHRKDYVEAIIQLKTFLVKTLGDERFFETASSILLNAAEKTLPNSLPLALGHGDFSPRNILIGPNARVTVLDTFATWRTSLYEDIGYFLNDLKMNYLQVVSQGFAFGAGQLAAYEQAFLEGYFHPEPIPYSAVRLCEALALLDKWSSLVARLYERPSSTQIVTQLKLRLASRYFKHRVKGLLDELKGEKRSYVLNVTVFALFIFNFVSDSLGTI
jgi:hypothetical protein